MRETWNDVLAAYYWEMKTEKFALEAIICITLIIQVTEWYLKEITKDVGKNNTNQTKIVSITATKQQVFLIGELKCHFIKQQNDYFWRSLLQYFTAASAKTISLK